MQFPQRTSLAVLLLALAACSSTSGGGGAPQAAQQPTPGAPGAQQAAPAQAGPFEKTGVFAPSNYAAIAIWPDQFGGGMIVLEVKPQGAQVAQGDVIATLDTRAIQDELHKAELEAQSSAIRHQGVVEKNRLDSEAAKMQLELAKSSLDRAQRSLEGWKKFELAFTKRLDEIMKRNEQANVEDQTDELDQLTKMYKDDALVSATEDIVIKRSVRQLDMTKTQNQLSRDRALYRESYDIAMQTEQKEEQVRTQAEAYDRLKKQLEIDARARKDAEVRSADSLREQNEKLEKLRRDREALVLRAPRAGVLLHGAGKDYRPGKTPPRYDRGSSLGFRQEIFLIADPAPTAVALDLGDGDLAKLPNGSQVNVQAVGAAPANAKGSLRVDAYPRTSSPNDATYEATVTLDTPITGAVYGARAKVTAEAPAKVQG